MGGRRIAGVSRGVWLFGFFGLLVPVGAVIWWCYQAPCSFLTSIIMRNYATFFVLPFGAFFAYFLVATLENGRGPIEFEFMTMKFKGASGPIILWLMIFLVLIFALGKLWRDPAPSEFQCSCGEAKIQASRGTFLAKLGTDSNPSCNLPAPPSKEVAVK